MRPHGGDGSMEELTGMDELVVETIQKVGVPGDRVTMKLEGNKFYVGKYSHVDNLGTVLLVTKNKELLYRAIYSDAKQEWVRL